MRISVFNGVGQTKVPESPYNDKTFIFQTIDIEFENIPYLFATSYVMNRNFDFKGERLRRSKSELEPFLTKSVEYIILDIDKVFSKEDEEFIINLFKSQNYYCMLMKSRSYNGKNNFNIKGIMKVTGKNNRLGIIAFLKQLQSKIGVRGEIDLTVANIPAYQAPALKEEVLLLQKGNKIPFIKEVKKEVIEIDNNDILYEAIKYVNSLGFKQEENKRDLIVFSHPSEKKSPKGFFMFKNNPLVLNHFNPSRSIYLFDALKDNPVIQKYLEAKSKQRFESLFLVRHQGEILELNKRFIQPKDIRNFIKGFLKNGKSLAVQSPMGTNKSEIIREVVKTDNRILFITNRVSIAKDIQKKYNIKFYRDGDYSEGDNLVCQFDSLYKYDLKNFDIIIIDEFISLILHSKNNSTNNVLNNIKLFYALKKKTILLDAFLFGIESKFVNVTHKIVNKYREETKLINYKNKNRLLSVLLKKAKEDTFLTISCNTKIEANAIAKMLEERGKKVLVIDSDATEDEKELLDNVEKYVDVLIYTPSITVGISFEFNSDYHFHIDTGNTIDIISSLQQMKRNRKAKEIHFYFKESKRKLPFDEEYLRKELKKNAKESFMFAFDENGNLSISEFGEFMIKCEVFYNLIQRDTSISFYKFLEMQFNLDYMYIDELIAEEFLSLYKKKYKEQEQEKYDKILKKYDFQGYSKDKTIEMLEELLPDKEMVKEAYLALKKDKNFLNKVKNFKIYSENLQDKILEKVISENASIDERNKYRLYSILKSKNFELKNRYTIKELKSLQFPLEKLKQFLLSVGYQWKYSSYMKNPLVEKLSKNMLL